MAWHEDTPLAGDWVTCLCAAVALPSAMEIVKPRDEDEVLAAVQAALEDETPIEILGQGSKRGLGRPVAAQRHVDMSGLTGVTLYEPAELVMTARPGTPLADIEKLLVENNQELAFEPMNPTKLWRGNSTGTIGGTVAVNAGGPRRIKAGAARDHLLGFRAVSGRGDIFKSGGQVMKNVTGYDLSKLIAGSYGTLAVLTEVSIKVLPKADTERTFLLYGLDEEAAVAALQEASGLSYEMSSFACIPDGRWLGMAPGCYAALRLEGPTVSVNKRFEDLVAHFGPRGRVDDLAEMPSRLFWAALRDAEPLADLPGPIWKISTTPSEGGNLMAKLRSADVPVARWYYDWAGGLIWLSLDAIGSLPENGAGDASAGRIRNVLSQFGGHATLVRADEAVRAATAVFQPQPAPLADLSRRVKASFDPLDILNRGRIGLTSDMLA